MREHDDEAQLAQALNVTSDSRQSIWTIRAEWIGWFYLLFTSQAAPLIFALWWSENFSSTHDNIASTITAIVSGSASLIFVAATASVIELEAVMVLKTLLERHFEKKDRQRAEQERQSKLEREKLRAELERGIEIGRQLEREERAAPRNGNNHNGDQEK
ncbi:MAG: hypothetical protein OXC83_12180 [Chloroflexi bacterium]|nr:hypothetical protein [Chloroflexota bacterium]